MTIVELLNDKSLKSKEKIETLSKWVLEDSLTIEKLLVFAENTKDSIKATCIEAIEYTTKENSKIGDEALLTFVTNTLTSKAPRVKWESAKVIGNIIHLFPNNLDEVISNLLINTNHEGTVVRWSAAFALGEILKMKTKYNKNLLSKIEVICEQENKNSIRKIYLKAIEQLKI